MLVIPAIDLKDGQCVRLYQGRVDRATVYADSPVEIARQFVQEGAQWLHLVDLDGAFAGRPQNTATIERIRRAVSIPMQLGGGIRNRDDAERYLNLGVERIILGTVALEDQRLLEELLCRYGERIAVGLDARNGMIATKGWAEQSGVSAVALAQKLDRIGVKTIIYTDIATDGTLSGPNIVETANIKAAVSSHVIASGGIGTLDDLRELMEHQIEAAIVGKALYSQRFSLAEAVAAGDGGAQSC